MERIIVFTDITRFEMEKSAKRLEDARWNKGHTALKDFFAANGMNYKKRRIKCK